MVMVMEDEVLGNTATFAGGSTQMLVAVEPVRSAALHGWRITNG